jgi:hypothetical protein
MVVSFASLAALGCGAARYQYDEETVTDVVENITWQRHPAGPMSRDAAVEYCATLELAGRRGWRLPEYNHYGWGDHLCHIEEEEEDELGYTAYHVDFEAFPDPDGNDTREAYTEYFQWSDAVCCLDLSSGYSNCYDEGSEVHECASPEFATTMRVDAGTCGSGGNESSAARTASAYVRCVRSSSAEQEWGGYYP